MDIHHGELPGILRLSPKIRHRIYLHADLGSRQFYGETAPGVYDLADKSGESMKNRHGIVDGFQSFHGLLLSCRTIYAEAAVLLYSANWFTIRYHTRWSLEPLQALTPRVLASLTNLKIVLSHDLLLDESGSLTEAMLMEWHATAAYLASHIVPGKLELAFICDVHPKNIETAKLALDGLLLLPQLKDCHIRLCTSQAPRLQQLAHEATLRARRIVCSNPVASSGSFSPRLVNLPHELQLRILEYTDLVAPWKEITWKRVPRGYRIERGPCSALEGLGHCTPESHHGCQFNQCRRMPWPQPSVGPFCCRKYAAFSSQCKCWAPPTPLFLVCRTLHANANLVFYSKNRFIIIDSPSRHPFTSWRPREYPYLSFAASHFLRHVVPPHCLGHIRFLELVFAPFTHLSRPRDEHPTLKDWSDTLDWAKDKLNPPALTLRLIMAGKNSDTWPQGSEEMTRAQGKEVLAIYTLILCPIRRLNHPSDGGLARFYADLVWPLRWTRWAALQEESARDWLESKDRELKRRAEHFIMGERYERVCVAGREPQGSVWTWSYNF